MSGSGQKVAIVTAASAGIGQQTALTSGARPLALGLLLGADEDTNLEIWHTRFLSSFGLLLQRRNRIRTGDYLHRAYNVLISVVL